MQNLFNMAITKDNVIDILKTINDPEVQLDVWSMGLIYDVEVKDKDVKITMTYTTPFCPWGPQLQDAIKTTVKDQLGAKTVDIDLTFDPPYKMPDELRATLGI